jgi:hypothetical protein
MAAPLPDTDPWSRRFTRRLMELQPELDLDAAIRACLEVMPSSSDLKPEEAAEVYHFANPHLK